MSLLVVGTVAYDSVSTKSGSRENAPGGSAFYFSISSSFFTSSSLVGVVGSDYSEKYFSMLEKSGVNIDGLEKVDGETFRWSGKYNDDDFNQRETLETHLNVLENFNPTLNTSNKNSKYLFLANIDPKIQNQVLDQMQTKPKIVALDTMNFWIDDHQNNLSSVIENVDIIFMDENEIKSFTKKDNIITAAKFVRQLGPRIVIVKKGEHGAIMFNEGDIFTAPAFPIEKVIDPTGAGDCFAGGFMGYLSGSDDLSPQSLRKALIVASVMGSFAVEGFSTEKLAQITHSDIEDRFRGIHGMTTFEPLNNNDTLPKRIS
tara:strand:+ start:4783 stop:5730 length:948 start_codon:yes stop_codon:yes gene_type:complete